MAGRKGLWFGVFGMLVACGARSTLDANANAETVAGTGGRGGAEGSTSTGGTAGTGGAEPQCEGLVWAGPAVGIGVAAATPAARPRLIRSSPTSVVLLFELATGNLELFSVPIPDPFGSWPPTPGQVEVHFPLVAPAAVSSGAAGEVAFSTLDPMGGATIIGRLVPEQNGSTFATLPLTDTPFSLGGTPTERFLLASGPSTFMQLHEVSTVVSPPILQTLGSVGCADRPLDAEVVATEGGSFWIANTSDQPHDDCLDADVPQAPRFVSLWRTGGTGLEAIAGIESSAAFTKVDLAVRGATAWVGAMDDLGVYTLLRHAEGEDDVLPLDTSSVPTEYDLGAILGQAIVARVTSAAATPSDALAVWLVTPAGPIASLSTPPEAIAPDSAPTILVEEDRALIAWADPTGTLWVARADCTAL